MEQLAEKIINDHNNRLTKVEIPGTKFFMESTETTNEQVEAGRNALEKALRHERVERRCGRIFAEILEDSNEIIVTKLLGSVLKHFGYQNKRGKFLYPEETLYLLETNRLELLKDKKSLSLKESYEVLLNDHGINSSKYLVYKTLVSQGYRLLRSSEFNKVIKQISTPQTQNKKHERKEQGKDEEVNLEMKEIIKTENEKCTPEDISTNTKSKKRKSRDAHGNSKKQKPNDSKCKVLTEPSHSRVTHEASEEDSSDEESSNHFVEPPSSLAAEIEEMFKRFREAGPKKSTFKNEKKEPDYYMYLPTNTNKHKPDFNLYVSYEENISLETHSDDRPSIHAMCPGDSVSFYALYDINLPNL